MNPPRLVALCLALAAAVPAANLSPPNLTGGEFAFTYDSSLDQLLTVQTADSPSGPWNDQEFKRGTGNALRFAAAAADHQRFFRVRIDPFQSLDLLPTSPALTNGAVSLPDATTGAAYLQTISPSAKGVPPYSLQITGGPPDGVTVSISSNATANASVRVSASGANLVSGQRRQVTIAVTDASSATTSRAYDLRVISPPPEILTTFAKFKSGQAPQTALRATNGFGKLTFQVISGVRPSGVFLATSGVFTGAPSADDAEFGGTGRFTNEVRVTDSLTDRVTGLPTPRSTTNTVVQLIRLSFSDNLWSESAGGPRFSGICATCHNSSFPPDLPSLGPALINAPTSVNSTFCASRIYVVPGSPEISLLYQKLTNPECGNRMPIGGPYLEDSQIQIVERWIRELEPGEMD
jgi:hypothetical protein